MDGASSHGTQGESLSHNVQPIEAATLKAIVRGEQTIADLKAAKLWINARRSEGTVAHALCVADLAEGIVNLKDDPVALAELANAIVAVSGHVSFEGEQSDRLISCVWNLALGEPLGERTIRLANAVRARFA